MPSYTYKCDICDHRFEQQQRIVDEPLRSCPICASENSLRRIITSGNFVLKGEGWFKTSGSY